MEDKLWHKSYASGVKKTLDYDLNFARKSPLRTLQG